jgi:hypothetical protein
MASLGLTLRSPMLSVSFASLPFSLPSTHCLSRFEISILFRVFPDCSLAHSHSTHSSFFCSPLGGPPPPCVPSCSCLADPATMGRSRGPSRGPEDNGLQDSSGSETSGQIFSSSISLFAFPVQSLRLLLNTVCVYILRRFSILRTKLG